MFKTAATRIAHNSTIPALAGNSDLRQFQDLINAEKVVLVSVQRLGVDLTKAAESLRTWGVGEGDDLAVSDRFVWVCPVVQLLFTPQQSCEADGMHCVFCDSQILVDALLILPSEPNATVYAFHGTPHASQLKLWLLDILSASTTLLLNFSAALSAYASTHHGIRDTMKSLRTREEALDDLRRRRRRVGTAAESAEKKLNKMSPEHKNLTSQTDALNRLHEDMRTMDGDIIREEAELGDFKRRCAKSWMQAKFGGLAECCEKGVIVGDIGKAIVAEIPEDVTQPGLPRAYYSSHPRISSLVSEAQRSIAQVVFTTEPSDSVGQEDDEHASLAPTSSQVQAYQPAFAGSPYLPAPQVGSGFNVGGFGEESSPTLNPIQRAASADELGVSTPTSTHPNQFASFPVRGSSRGALLHDGPIPAPLPLHDASDTFTNTIADALALRDSNAPEPNRSSVDDPAPKYEPFVPGSSAQYAGVGDTRRNKSPSLPPGAAPAAIRAWDGGLRSGNEDQRAMSESNDHSTSVAYITGIRCWHAVRPRRRI
ncbi:hypothetical protein M405DRAFT_609905 [Rhizopogon salebrosus TDB-379]|nr:hypothetical protein M405DRAFT_609905 [Rhizopogon salebrosus TDB-379]